MDEALKFNSQLLKDTKRFIDLYRRDSMKEHVNRLIDLGLRVTFQGRPLLLYAKIVAETARRQAQQHRELIAAGLPGKYELLYRTSRSNRVEIKNLFEQVTFDEKRFRFIESALNQNSTALPKEILIPLAETDKLPETPEKAEKMEKIVTKYDQLPAQPIQTTKVVEAPVKPEEILATPEETNKELLNYKQGFSTNEDTSKKEVKYTPKEHPKYSSPEDLKKLDQLLTTPTSPPEKSAPEAVVVEPVPVIPEKFIPVTPPKTEDKTQTGDKPKSVVAEKKTGGSKTAVIPSQRPQNSATPLPKVALPRLKEDLRQKISALQRFQLPYPVQNLAKNTLSFGKRLIIHNTPTIISTTIGGFVGGALAGPAGIPAGLVGGGLFPRVIKSGLLQKGATVSVAKGAGKLALKGALGLSNPVGWAWLALSAPGVKTVVKYAVIAFLAIFALPIFMNLNKSQSLFPPYDTAYSAPIPPGEPGGNTPVNQSCKFTRAGVSAPYGSTTLLNWINSAALNKGIPPAVLASIARHESPDFTTNADNNHDDIKSNRYCHPGPTFCEQSGKVLHYDACTAGEISSGAKTAKALGLMQVIDIYNPGVDLCKITTNIDSGAEILKSKLGGGSFNNADQLKQAVCRYFGVDSVSCPYPGGDYGNEVWNDYQNCQTAQPGAVIANMSCPVPNGEITCASYGKSYSGTGPNAFAGNCAVDASGNGGHCSEIYQKAIGICTNRADTSGNLIRTAKSIDVSSMGGNTPGDPVYLPIIRGKGLTWIYQGYVNAGKDFGEIRLFKSEPTPEGIWSIHFVHVKADDPPLNPGDKVQSGKIGAKMIFQDTGTHVHVTVGLNVGDSVNDLKDYSPKWLFADRDLGMCVK